MSYLQRLVPNWQMYNKIGTFVKARTKFSLSGFEIITWSLFFLFRVLLVTHLMRTPHHQITHTTYLHLVLQYMKECKVVTLLLFG